MADLRPASSVEAMAHDCCPSASRKVLEVTQKRIFSDLCDGMLRNGKLNLQALGVSRHQPYDSTVDGCLRLRDGLQICFKSPDLFRPPNLLWDLLLLLRVIRDLDHGRGRGARLSPS